MNITKVIPSPTFAITVSLRELEILTAFIGAQNTRDILYDINKSYLFHDSKKVTLGEIENFLGPTAFEALQRVVLDNSRPTK